MANSTGTVGYVVRHSFSEIMEAFEHMDSEIKTNSSCPRLPDAYLGAVQVRQPRLFSTHKAIGLAVDFPGEHSVLDQRTVVFEVVINVFGRSPTLSQTGTGQCRLNLETRHVEFYSESGAVSLQGTLSEDWHLLEGEVDFRGIHVMDVQGDFLGHTIVLEAFEEDGD